MQALTLLFYLAGMLFLEAGLWEPQAMPLGSHGVTSSIQTVQTPPLPFDLTIWTPPRQGFQLCDFQSDRPKAAPAGRDDDASVRPAWGMLIGVVVLFLYLMGTSHDIVCRLY